MRSTPYILFGMFLTTLIVATPVLAQADAQAAQFPWEGEVTGENVYVRSGAGSNWYPSTKLNTGDRILVLGEKFGWYQILPPDESFSYIDMAAVDRNTGTNTAVVNRDKVYVRAGSHLNNRKTATQVVLSKGAQVKITGAADGLYKIAPPKGASLYISKQFVKTVPDRLGTGMVQRYLAGRSRKPGTPRSRHTTPRTKVNTPAVAHNPAPAARTGQPPATPPSIAKAEEESLPLEVDPTIQSLKEQATTPKTEATSPAVRLAEGPTIADAATTSADQKPAGKVATTVGRYRALLDVIEGELAEMLRQPLPRQDLAAMRTRYEEIANQKDEKIPAEIARIRIAQLTNRMELQEARAGSISESEELAALRTRLTAERMEIKRRQNEKALAEFDLEGELMVSHAFDPQKRRYRLIDPETRRTIAYVDIPSTLDAKPEQLIGRRVGIRSSGKRFSAAARVPIAVAASVIELSSNTLTASKTPDSSKAPNKAAQTDKSSTTVAAHPEEE